MSRIDRTERLLNLVICLMASSIPVSRTRIHAEVNGYADASTPVSFERMFERDKDELRSMGIPVETVTDVNGEVLGYRIDTADYRLEERQWTLAERAALGLAARTWARATSDLGGSLAAAKIESISDTADIQPPVSITASGIALLPLMRALRAREPVEFDYVSSGAEHATQRTLSPWALSLSNGHWYAVGHDHGRNAQRTFRVSRVNGPVRASEGEYVPAPAGFDATTPVSVVQDVQAWAQLEVTPGRGAPVRLLDCTRVGDRDGRDVLHVKARSESELLASILACASDVMVVEPPEIRARIMTDLSALVAAHGGTHG